MEQTLHRDTYLEHSWFKQECRDIFSAEWFCVARSEELPAVGDYRTLALAGEQLLIVRGEDLKLRAFYNVCRHRGCQLIDSTDASVSSGHFRKRIRCPYHSWSYGLDGSLQNTPHIDVDKSELPLYGVPLQEWGGFIFLRLSKEADKSTGVLQQLGPIVERVARYPLHELQSHWRREYRVAANWKVILENYNECYHCAGVHPELCTVVPAFREKGAHGLDWEAGVPQREGTNTFTMSGKTTRPPMPGLNEVEKVRHFGELIYPNLMLSLAMDHAAAFMLFPLGPEETLIDCRLLFHPNAVESADFDPADSADFWHLVNEQDWRICERVQRGMQSAPFEHGYYAPMEDLSLDIRNYVATRMK
ncbi:MAG: aromatic ring-hydroxylating dioxygenase subunit alpha [Woeseia sp.]